MVASNQESISIIAHLKVLDDVDFKRQGTQLIVVLPNGVEIPVEEGDCDGGNDILCITCHNLPGVDCGFGNLVAIDFCGQDVQEHDKVYTYCDHHNSKLLTPGRVLYVYISNLSNFIFCVLSCYLNVFSFVIPRLVEDETFDHNCAVSKEMEFGGVVKNV